MIAMAQRKVLLFAKAPVAGRVKTRLAPALGEDGTLTLYRHMLEHMIHRLVGSGIAAELWLDDPGHPFFCQWSDQPMISFHRQSLGDLGARMSLAFEQRLTAKADEAEQRVVAIGADCPFIDEAYLEQAFEVLEAGSDCVLGPAEDGGYVLLGLRCYEPSIFEKIDWGSCRVLQQTRARLELAGLSYSELSQLSDIDEPEDLAALKKNRTFSHWLAAD